MRSSYKIAVKNLYGRAHLVDQGVNERIQLKLILKEGCDGID
jgi:hypothetical protein